MAVPGSNPCHIPNPTLRVWRILPTLYDQRLAHHREILEAFKVKYPELLYSEPVRATTKYKDAVTNRSDVSDLDPKLGDYWDTLAQLLIRRDRGGMMAAIKRK